ncbi:citrate synthase-like protein [Catenaria anguillulae PL171]|uniref:Citrate synthase n=1 Tax=Catenaria anguillulae PL171 TaxID=765915 RepID=A0A1Y2HIR4_9FUNG|nr:citrate synthase-like protein [Catenaria anguillulae PL171]
MTWTLPAPAPASGIEAGPSHSSFVVLPSAGNAQSLTILDNRTNRLYTVPLTKEGAVNATAFAQIKSPTGEGLRVYDSGYMNTAVCRSKICEIDGDRGILRYRGFPIEELAEKSSFLEVAYLLVYGELPSADQFKYFEHEVMHHTFIHMKLSELLKQFNYDAHPMGMFIAAMSALSTFDPSGNPALAGNDIYIKDKALRNKQIFRILGKVTTIAAMTYRHRIGRPYNNPRSDLSYTENFLAMLDTLSEPNYRPNPVLAKALDVLFILHADHELNASTAAMRHLGSTLVDPYSAVAGAAAALYGPLHGGANEAVVRMLESIGKPENVAGFLDKVKRKEKKLMGFGHRIYRSYDPRATIIRKVAYEVFDVVGKEPLIEVAKELEKQALADDYFAKRKLYPNVDFWSGLIYKACGFPTDFYPVLFAIPRVAGWLAHWSESLDDAEARIWRPRQLYVGEGRRSYVPMEHRTPDASVPVTIKHPFSKRSSVATWDGKAAPTPKL